MIKMDVIREILGQFSFIVKDGGLATEIEKMGYSLRDVLWSSKMLVENPGIIKKVHESYLEAGADLLITSSYQASIPGFIKGGFGEADARRYIRLSAALAAGARDEFWDSCADKRTRPRPLVAGSVGCYGAYLANGAEYRGDYRLSGKEYRDFHGPRIEELLGAGCDMIAFETVPLLEEAVEMALLMKDFPGVPSMLCFSARDGIHISSGEDFSDCVREIGSIGSVTSIGINCSDPLIIEGLVRTAVSAAYGPVAVYPNSGEYYDIGCMCWRGEETKKNYRELALKWYGSGARIIGGCCRTGPDEIRAVAELRGQLTVSRATSGG